MSQYVIITKRQRKNLLMYILIYRASLEHVYFPSVTLCNINQGRRSFFLAHGLQNDSRTLKAVLGQAYFGVPPSKVILFENDFCIR